MMKFPARSGFAVPIAVLTGWTIPILYFSGKNAGDLPLGEATLAFLVSGAAGLLVWKGGRHLFRSQDQTAIFAVFLTFPIFHFRTILIEVIKVSPSRPSLVLYAMILLATAGAFLLIRRLSPAAARTGVSYLAVVGTILFLYYAVLFGIKLEGTTGVSVTVRNADLVEAADTAEPAPAASRPDIFYLVLDRYTGQIGLRESYGFDNGAFVRSLERKGFYVADASFANYPVTASSLASSLNGGLIEASGDVSRVRSRKQYHPLIANPAVGAYLQWRGYRFVNLGSWWGATQRIPTADRNDQSGWQLGPDGFSVHPGNMTSVFLINTIVADLQEKLFGPFQVDNAQGTIFNRQVTKIESLAKPEAGPKFVFAHVLMPHPPFAFDATGGTTIDRRKGAATNFLEQLVYTSQRLDELTDKILGAYPADRPPIIVLTADEGEYPYSGEFSTDDADANLREKLNILNAFYFPDGRYDELYETITPVNNFRAMFNEFFGGTFKRQPDTIYTTTSHYLPYDFVDVTERVRSRPGPPGSGSPVAPGKTKLLREPWPPPGPTARR